MIQIKHLSLSFQGILFNPFYRDSQVCRYFEQGLLTGPGPTFFCGHHLTTHFWAFRPLSSMNRIQHFELLRSHLRVAILPLSSSNSECIVVTMVSAYAAARV